jgi:hypothetical protein
MKTKTHDDFYQAPQEMDINAKMQEIRTLAQYTRSWFNMTGQGSGYNGDSVDIKPKATWNGEIRLIVPETENEDGVKKGEKHPLEVEWAKLSKEHRITEKFLRADRACGIGQYSILFLGLSDPGATEPKNPVDGSSLELKSIKVFKQDNAEVVEINGNPASNNFGMPQKYQIGGVIDDSSTNSRDIDTGGQFGSPSITRSTTVSITGDEGEIVSGTEILVDASRIIHIAEDLLENDIYGTPRLEAPLNNIQDYEKVTGGSAEMFWRGALPGWVFEIDPESDYEENDETQKKEFENQVDNLLLSLRRYIRLQGIKPHSLAPQVSDPKSHVEVQGNTISAITRIPKRKLFGSERGELASGQDEVNWAGEINGRRRNDCERWLRDFIDKMMEYGILPEAEEYIIEWPEVSMMDIEKISKVALNISNAIRNYFATPQAEEGMPLEIYLTEVLRFPEDIVRKVLEMREAEMVDEDADLIEDDLFEEV